MTAASTLQAEALRYLQLGPLAPTALLAILLDRFEDVTTKAEIRQALWALMGLGRVHMTRDLRLEIVNG